MVYICVAIGIVLICVVLSPFMMGPGGMLAPGSSINSKEQLDALKQAVLKRYLEDEAAFKAGNLSRIAWDKRRNFLVNRYVDAARRRDFLESSASAPTSVTKKEAAS